MRALFCHRPGGAFGYITDGMINALKSCGHAVQRWDGKESSWRAFNPDIYIGASGHKQPIPQMRGKCKVALHVNPFGPIKIQGIDESQESIQWVKQQRPDVVFGYGSDLQSHLWSYWPQQADIVWVPMPTAGDDTIYGLRDIERKPMAVYVGGRWAYKAKSIDPYFTAMTKANIDLNIRGWGEWQQYSKWYRGAIDDSEVTNFFNSGMVAPCIAEPHTHTYHIDVPERPFKVALCGCIIIHDNTIALSTFIPSAIICANPEEMMQRVMYFLDSQNIDETIALAERQRLDVLRLHTYRHRLNRLLYTMGFIAEAATML